MENLQKLHKVEIDILEFVVNICESNHLGYCLIYGSALGAYRHEGFIPWDDDIDIGMPYKDYIKLKSIITQIDSEFEFQDMYNEEHYYMLFGKVRKKGTVFRESITEDYINNCGIYIDIFPLYYTDRRGIKIHFINYIKHIIKFSTHRELYKKKYSKEKYLFSCIISFPTFFVSSKKLLLYINNFIIKHYSHNTGTYLVEWDENGEIQVINSNIYFPTVKLCFEGKTYNVPGRIEEYLTLAYGKDYMTLPPIEERHTHMPSVLSFGDE